MPYWALNCRCAGLDLSGRIGHVQAVVRSNPTAAVGRKA